jgi:hypothetical protein
MKRPDGPPEIEEKTETELETILRDIDESNLSDSVKSFVRKCVKAALWFPYILEQKTISLKRLRVMIFGKGYQSKNNKDDEATSNSKNKEATSASDTEEQTDNSESLTTSQQIEAEVEKASDEEKPPKTNTEEKKPGHGRMSHTVYKDFTEIQLTITGLNSGDPCPNDCGGRVYEYKPDKPRVLVRIKGQNFADVYKYIVQRLRCNLCHELFQATIPPEVGKDKYDASFKAMMAVQKYFVAVPFYRQETFQTLLHFPLPDATQWDLIEQLAGYCYGVFLALTVCAANGKLIHNDDTTVRIQEVIAKLKANPGAERTGMFTSGFMADYEGHQIALFLNGTSHAGENLASILKKREEDKPPIIQMCDALSCNLTKEAETILCNCLSHGFRKFEELTEYFPTPCITIMKLLNQVYENDKVTKRMNDDERLHYHQQHSQPIMDLLAAYMQALFDEKRVEPNSELGKAIRYMQRHWKKLTRFLSKAGAPIDNNIVERALKIAIRNRKSAMFYRTCYSAHIGGMLTSLIYTCHLANENALDYLIALQQYADSVREQPKQWLPWNYKATLGQLNASEIANPPGCGPPQAALVAR